jgi:ankyrin repeat protein
MLHILVNEGCHFSFIQKAIEYGVEIDAKDNDGTTPLQYAIFNGLYNIAVVLLKNGANPNAVDIKGRTSLHYAVFQDKIPYFELLFHYGSKIDTKDVYGYTALGLANAYKYEVSKNFLENRYRSLLLGNQQ